MLIESFQLPIYSYKIYILSRTGYKTFIYIFIILDIYFTNQQLFINYLYGITIDICK